MSDEPPRRPTPPHIPSLNRPRLTPVNEARLLPVDQRSAAAYTASEAAAAELESANRQAARAGAKLDEVLAVIEDAAVMLPLEMSESLVHTIRAARPADKKGEG